MIEKKSNCLGEFFPFCLFSMQTNLCIKYIAINKRYWWLSHNNEKLIGGLLYEVDILL